MDKPKKEPIALRHRQDNKLCLNCGFPNRPSDAQCMYCSANLVEDKGLLSWFRQTYYVLRWRWQLKQKRDNLSNQKPQMSATKGFGYFALGMVLSGSGLYIFTLSITENSISNALIAILLILYGFFTLKSFLTKK